jgi:hypothetical protein
MQASMNAHAIAKLTPQRDVCPYCGQPISHQKLDEIRQRVRREEQVRLRALEKQLREQALAQIRKQTQDLARRSTELAKQERTLRQRAKLLEAQVKAQYEAGYRKAQTEAQRIHMQLQKQIEDLRRRVERKTADELGATSEEDLLALLRRSYPGDRIEPVPRGTNGADIVQDVREHGAACGRIVYESKNVKTFLNAYVDKAKSYRTQYDTPHVILVTTAFPGGERDFCARDGILLIHPAKVRYLIDILRQSIADLARAGASRTQRDTKGERLLAYVGSDEFKQRLRGILDAVDDLRCLQDEERKRHEATWGAQQEAHRGLERFAGQIQARVRAIAEGRG